MKLFIISDTHYYHTKIIEYENRPFNDIYLYKYILYDKVHEMNEYMVKQHNNVVTDNDIVLYLGDFSFGGKNLVESLFNRLNGKKYIVMGNHDRKRTVTWFTKLGFIKAFKKPIYLNNFILSHEPIKPDKMEGRKKINFHGHIHNSVHYDQFLNEVYFPERYVNFAAEFLDYKPFEIKDKKTKKEILNFLLYSS